MPKETFFNLSQEKKDNLFRVMYKLFIENKYEDVTIRDLVKEAKIPIGSFYRYFEDKDDLYIYMIKLGEQKIYDELAAKKDYTFSPMMLGTASEEILRQVLSKEEYEFDETFSDAPDKLLQKFYFYEFSTELEDEYRKNLLRLKEQGRLREDIDCEFLLYIYKTSMFNIIMYYREKGITEFEEREKIKNAFFNKFFLRGVTK